MQTDTNEIFEKGKACLETGNEVEAMRHFMQATLLAPDKGEYHAWLSLVFNRQENYSGALESANKALELDPNCSLAFRQRAYVYYMNKKDCSKAIRDYSRAIELSPEDSISYFWRGCAYYALEDYKQAIQDYSQAIKYDSTYTITYYWRGLAYKWLDNIDRAIDDFTKAIRLNPNSSRAYLKRGDCHFSERAFSAAIQDYSKVIQIDPDNIEAYSSRADAYLMQREFGLSIQDYSHAIRRNPTDEHLFIARGVAYGALGDTTKQVKDFTEAIQLNPAEVVAYEYRGKAFLMQKEYTKAVQDYSKAIELGSETSEILQDRGLAYAAQKEYGKAIADLKQSIELDSKNSSAYELRGNVYLEMGNYPEALQDLSQALELDPNNPELQNTVQSVKTMLDSDSEPAIQLSNEALQYFSQAINLIQNTDQASYDRACRDAISLLSESIRVANAPFPRAHALRAMLYIDLEEYEAAWNEADRALELDPDEFRAQNVKTSIAGGSVRVADTGIVKGIFKIFTARSARESYQTSYDISAAKSSQRRFKKEVIKLLQIFERLCAKPLEASEYLYYAETLIDLADSIIQNHIPIDRNVNIYRSVALTPVENLMYESLEQKREVNRIRTLAKGRASSFR